MTNTLISAHLPPNIDPTKVELAYSERALPKLNEELNHTDLIVRQKALMTLCDVVHNAEYVTQTIKCAIIDSLKSLLKDEDAVVRMKTTEVLLIISGHAIGRQVLIEEEVIKPLSLLFDDACYEVRLNTHRTIEMVSSSPPGPSGIVECNLIPILINKLSTEVEDIKLIILDTLHRAMRISQEQSLENNAMEVYTTLLTHSNVQIRAKAAMDIKELSFPTEGKDKACDVGSIAMLSNLLNDEDADVRAQACAALMVITITTRGKLEAMQQDILPSLMKMLEEERSEIRLNTLKLITTLSETPNGRLELLKSLHKISKLKHDHESAAVRKAAQIAEKSITWKP